MWVKNSPLQIYDERQLKTLTGVTKEQFDHLAQELSIVYEEERHAKYNADIEAGKRKRKVGGGRKGVLESIELKLLFILYYLKNCPTFDTLGSIFGMVRSKACENIHKLMPLLQIVLQRLKVMPHREFESVEEFQEAFKLVLSGIEVDVPALLIDATDSAHQRPVDEQE